MKPGVTSRPSARDSRSQPPTRMISAAIPMKKLLHEVHRSARYSAKGVRVGRIAIHAAASTAGNPKITESEMVSPPPMTRIASAMSSDPPCRSTKKAITATWPRNIAAKMNRPHSVVPQNFQTRGGRSGIAGGTATAVAGVRNPSDGFR